MSYNPSLFINLPRGVRIYQSDVERAIDAQDYGEIKQVSIQTTKSGDRNAVVHFSRWFRSNDDILDKLTRGFIYIKTCDFGTWRASAYIVKSPNVTIRKPKKQEKQPKKQEQRPRSPIMTDEAEIPEVILEFIETCRNDPSVFSSVEDAPSFLRNPATAPQSSPLRGFSSISEQQYVDVVLEEQVFRVPIALCLSDAHPVLSVRHPDDMELEEGEILAL